MTQARKLAMLPVTLVFAAMFVAGILFWGAFNWTMELTNTESFCISCHEMRDNVYVEYKQTVHYSNRTGVRATCPDCHVPKDWVHKVVRKVRATNELYHAIIGSIDSREKFQARRLHLATSVWDGMRQTDSRECRNCHAFKSMQLDHQKARAGVLHELGSKWGMTCIDCHKGIAHSLPDDYDPDIDLDALHVRLEEQEIPCYTCHEDMARPDPGDAW